MDFVLKAIGAFVLLMTVIVIVGLLMGYPVMWMMNYLFTPPRTPGGFRHLPDDLLESILVQCAHGMVGDAHGMVGERIVQLLVQQEITGRVAAQTRAFDLRVGGSFFFKWGWGFYSNRRETENVLPLPLNRPASGFAGASASLALRTVLEEHLGGAASLVRARKFYVLGSRAESERAPTAGVGEPRFLKNGAERTVPARPKSRAEGHFLFHNSILSILSILSTSHPLPPRSACLSRQPIFAFFPCF